MNTTSAYCHLTDLGPEDSRKNENIFESPSVGASKMQPVDPAYKSEQRHLGMCIGFSEEAAANE